MTQQNAQPQQRRWYHFLLRLVLLMPGILTGSYIGSVLFGGISVSPAIKNLFTVVLLLLAALYAVTWFPGGKPILKFIRKETGNLLGKERKARAKRLIGQNILTALLIIVLVFCFFGRPASP